MKEGRPWFWAGVGGLAAAGLENVLLAFGPLYPSVLDLLLGVAFSAILTVPIGLVAALMTREAARAVAAGALCAGVALAWIMGGGLQALAMAGLVVASLRVPLLPLTVVVGTLSVLLAAPHIRRPAPGAVTVLITVDGLRADAWPALRHTGELAVHGRRLLGVAPSPDLEVSLDAVLDGRMPWSLGGTPLAERSRRAGCDTAAFVSRAVGPRGGFSTFDDTRGAPALWPRTGTGRLMGVAEPEERPAWVTASVAARWLETRTGCAFAWVHLSDPLAPLEPPPPWDARFYDGRDPRATSHPGLHPDLADAFPGVRDPEFVRASYLGEVGVVDAAVGELAVAAGEHARIAVVGLGGLTLGPDHWLGKSFEPQTLEVPVALHGEAPSLNHTISLADVYGWLSGDLVAARPWAVDEHQWGVRAAHSWRIWRDGEIEEIFPEGDAGDRARRRLMLDLEQGRLEEARIRPAL